MKILTIIRWELWQRRWALMWWAIGVGALVSIDMMLYTAVKDQAAELGQALANMPAALKALFSDSADFLSPVGFLSARVYYLLLPLLLSIFTIGLGASLLGREEQNGTLELLLARPISRTKLLLSKISSGVLATGLLGLVALIVGLACLRPAGFEEISHRAIAITTLNAVLLSALFGAIALLVSTFGRSLRRASVGIAALVAFGSYLITSLESLASWLTPLAKITPYYYFRPADILSGASVGWKSLVGFSLAIGICFVAAWMCFRRRDITTS